MKTTVTALVLALTFVGASNAAAGPITITGNTTFTINWLNTTTTPDLAGSADFAISNYTTSGFKLAITAVRNTMPTTPDIDARLINFAFGFTPDVTFSDRKDGDVYEWNLPTQNSGGFNGQVDLCAASGPNCNAVGNGGLNQGESTAEGDIMSVLVAGNFLTGVTFDPIQARFHTNAGALVLDGCVAGPGCEELRDVNDVPMPEPASMVLFGTGLLGLAAAVRRRARRA